MGWLDVFRSEKKTSAQMAKERLQVVVAHRGVALQKQLVVPFRAQQEGQAGEFSHVAAESIRSRGLDGHLHHVAAVEEPSGQVEAGRLTDEFPSQILDPVPQGINAFQHVEMFLEMLEQPGILAPLGCGAKPITAGAEPPDVLKEGQSCRRGV